MTAHFTQINKFKGKLEASSLNMNEKASRVLVLEMAIKCGDLNNVGKSLEIAKEWSFRVMDEFFKQVTS
jgi:hypothetical protein